MKAHRFLMLGGQPGWHFDQLSQSAAHRGVGLQLASYESLTCRLPSADDTDIECSAGRLFDFDAVLTRTMPAGSLEQITFRLATLHCAARSVPVVNHPASLEVAIDKFAALSIVNSLGYPIPETLVTQERKAALDAFDRFGGDCVVKPIFGGEGFGVMRVQHRELAKTTFTTLQNQNAVIYLQRFIPPGGIDTRLIRFGGPVRGVEDRVIAVRRRNEADFRTNMAHGGKSEQIETQSWHIELADRVCEQMGLTFASVDLLDGEDRNPLVVEVNGIPGWKGAQAVCRQTIADHVIDCLMETVRC